MPLPHVRSILEIDVQLLEYEFVNGCRESDRYIESYMYAPFDKDGRAEDFNGAKTWGEH